VSQLCAFRELTQFDLVSGSRARHLSEPTGERSRCPRGTEAEPEPALPMSLMHSAPSAIATSRSVSTPPGSCIVCGMHNDARASESRPVNVQRSARSAS
jgi:hypothetical protein